MTVILDPAIFVVVPLVGVAFIESQRHLSANRYLMGMAWCAAVVAFTIIGRQLYGPVVTVWPG